MKHAIILVTLLFLVGCQGTYSRVRPGELSGRLTVEWYGPDRFIFRPNEQSPLTFVRADGDRVQPGTMRTDGGSVPRPLWVFRNYSPWGYAPAFIVHDWLFEMKRCGLPGNEKYDHHVAAVIMAEVMRTMMERGVVPKSPSTVNLMHAAVDSTIASAHWENGVCDPVEALESDEAPLETYEFSF